MQLVASTASHQLMWYIYGRCLFAYSANMSSKCCMTHLECKLMYTNDFNWSHVECLRTNNNRATATEHTKKTKQKMAHTKSDIMPLKWYAYHCAVCTVWPMTIATFLSVLVWVTCNMFWFVTSIWFETINIQPSLLRIFIEIRAHYALWIGVSRYFLSVRITWNRQNYTLINLILDWMYFRSR